jgi:hypothetical protein
MGGKKKKSTTQTYKPPSWVEGAAQQAVGIGQGIASQEYTPYEGQRVAGLSQNELMGMEMARDSVGIATPYYEEAAGLARSSTQSWADLSQAERDAYMNPYIKGALDPAAREIPALMRQGAQEKTLQGIKDLYGEGYARAYDSAVGIWGDEKAREYQASGRIQELGTALQTSAQQDISTLMATGATDRSIQQAILDFDYTQFIENRDWGFRQLGGLISALEGTKGSYTTTQTSTTESKGGGFAQALGLGAALLGAFYNPAGLAAGMAGGTGG